MRPYRCALAAAFAAALVLPPLAHGAGYGIYEQGAASLGMAGATTASVHDAAAEFYDPAALPSLEGNHLYLGGTWLTTHVSFAGTDPFPGFGTQEAMKTGNFFPPTAYWTSHLGKKWAYGLGLDSPFGLGVEWEHPETFTGRTRVTKANLNTLNGNFDLAWAMAPTVSLAVGFDALFGSVDLNNILEQPIPGGGGATANIAKVELKSGLKPGYGFNAAARWTPNMDWKFALAYRSKVDVDIKDGDATFTQMPTGDAAFDAQVQAGLPPAQKVGTTLHFPAIWSVGAAWMPMPDWTYEADFNWTQWKAFDALVLTFPSNAALDQTLVENYKDSFRVSVGAEHRLARYTYRFGYYFDQAAAPTESVTPLLPDTNRHGATFGLGWNLGAKKAWTLDVYELALFTEERSTEGMNRDHFDGTYKSFINGAGLGLDYRW